MIHLTSTNGLKGATFSDDQTQRYHLWRNLIPNHPGPGPGRLLCIGINPSTADHEDDDRTIQRISAIARYRGFGRLDMANLYSLRSRAAQNLLKDPGPLADLHARENDHALYDLMQDADLVLAAWGGPWQPKALAELVAEAVVNIRKAAGKPLYCLGVTKDGHPRHPLFMPVATEPVLWNP